MKFQLGLKLWSVNTHLIGKVRELYEDTTVSHLELYCVPDSYKRTIKAWSTLDIPYIIHAPNESILDISDHGKLNVNQSIFAEVQQFADTLSSDVIVIHPGVGDIEENIQQIQSFRDERICIENMPYYSLHNDLILNGSTYQDIKKLIENIPASFCLDIGHAVVGALNLHVNYMDLIQELLTLKPSLFHLNDGFVSANRDHHEHFGDGDFPIKQLLELIPSGSRISLETPKDLTGDLVDFVNDIGYIKNASQSERL